MTTPAPEVPGRHEAEPVAYETAPPNATEPKVMAATGGATVGVILTNFALDLIARAYGGPLPESWVLVVGLGVTSGLTFAAGRYARHVNRA